jgi:negative regulator of sigma-B (phosphoserine phosphatase)
MITNLYRIKCAIISEPLHQEEGSGDQFFIKEYAGFSIVCVIDGLGHGKDAMHAANVACSIIDKYAYETVDKIILHCHSALSETRGAAITLLKIDINYYCTYIAIGNVIAVIWQLSSGGKFTKKYLFIDSGIVGARLPATLIVKEIALASSDRFIIATDGLKPSFVDFTPKLELPDKIARDIFNEYSNLKDDRLIVVGQFL